MTSSLESLTFTVPLTAAKRLQARQLAQQMPYADKATDVERNLLAVLATQYYLQLLGLSSNLTDSHSWDVLHHWTGIPSDLSVTNGHVYCCPITPDQTIISLPDTDTGSLGYVIVQLSDDLTEAIMLGFAPTTAQQITRNQLQPLDALVDCLTATPVERLRDWLDNKISTAWDNLDNLLSNKNQPEILMAPISSERIQSSYRTSTQITNYTQERDIQEFYSAIGNPIPTNSEDLVTDLSRLIQQLDNDEQRWQAAELLWNIVPNHPNSPVILIKDLGLYLSGYAIGLEVGILPRQPDHFLVLVRLRSIGQSPILPDNLQFSGNDEQENTFFTLSSRSNDRYIQFKFNASAGDAFNLTIQLEESQIVEGFII